MERHSPARNPNRPRANGLDFSPADYFAGVSVSFQDDRGTRHVASTSVIGGAEDGTAGLSGMRCQPNNSPVAVSGPESAPVDRVQNTDRLGSAINCRVQSAAKIPATFPGGHELEDYGPIYVLVPIPPVYATRALAGEGEQVSSIDHSITDG
jgi:hypothetical protein